MAAVFGAFGGLVGPSVVHRMAGWTPGLDNPLIHKGRGVYFCDQTRLLVGNLLWHVRRDRTLQAHIAETISASATGDHKHDHFLVAHLMGMSRSLVYAVEAEFDQRGWA